MRTMGNVSIGAAFARGGRPSTMWTALLTAWALSAATLTGAPAWAQADPYQEGMRAFGAERYGEASERFRQALAAKPGHIGYAYMLAMSLSRQGEAAASIEHFQLVIDKSPDDDLVAKAYVNLLRTLVDAELYDKVDMYAATAATRLPPNAEVLNQQGRAKLNRGEPEAAVKVLSEATRLDTSNWTIYNNLGLAYLRVGNLKGAQLAFERAAKLNDRQAFVFNNLGMVYEGLQMYDEATNAFNAALALDANYSKAQQAIKRIRKLKAATPRQNYTIETPGGASDGH